jgi:hypothetical protein
MNAIRKKLIVALDLTSASDERSHYRGNSVGISLAEHAWYISSIGGSFDDANPCIRSVQCLVAT